MADERAILFRFASRLWLRELDQPTLKQLQGPLSESWQSIGGKAPVSTLENLQADFCQLLTHPKSYVAPFQSVWTSGQLGGSSVSSMRNWMSETGYLTQVAVEEIPDHLGVQLDLYGWMTSRKAESGEDQPVVVEVTRRYAQQHLSWTGKLLEQATAAANTKFYRSVISVTRDLLTVI